MSDAIATVILAGMMFVPIINLFVGIIVGASLFAYWGAAAGAAIAVLITIAQNQILDWRQVRSDRREHSAEVLDFPAPGAL
jgi:LytS/YehU family sensor histidine kinase